MRTYTFLCAIFLQKWWERSLGENVQLVKFTQREICKPIGYKYWNAVLKNKKKNSHKYISYYESTYESIYVKHKDGCVTCLSFPNFFLSSPLLFRKYLLLVLPVLPEIIYKEEKGNRECMHTCIQSRMASSLTWLCFLIITE